MSFNRWRFLQIVVRKGKGMSVLPANPAATASHRMLQPRAAGPAQHELGRKWELRSSNRGERTSCCVCKAVRSKDMHAHPRWKRGKLQWCYRPDPVWNSKLSSTVWRGFEEKGGTTRGAPVCKDHRESKNRHRKGGGTLSGWTE